MKKSKYQKKVDETEKLIRLALKARPSREQALSAVRTIIKYIGENPDRPGLVKTPERVIRAWEEWTEGYNKKYIQKQTLSILNGQFDDGAEQASEMICVQDVKTWSHCEHHLAEFAISADVAYIPSKGGKILGLSKLVRVVEMFSKRLQVQERLTNQIADFIQIHCRPLGVGVVIRAEHSCMRTRGVKSFSAFATTSALRGEFLTVPEVRSEFLQLTRR